MISPIDADLILLRSARQILNCVFYLHIHLFGGLDMQFNQHFEPLKNAGIQVNLLC